MLAHIRLIENELNERMLRIQVQQPYHTMKAFFSTSKLSFDVFQALPARLSCKVSMATVTLFMSILLMILSPDIVATAISNLPLIIFPLEANDDLGLKMFLKPLEPLQYILNPNHTTNKPTQIHPPTLDMLD
jgi:hypothetical protein